MAVSTENDARNERLRHEELVARIRDMIVEGELAPGNRVSERALCERFAVSRTPLREALKVLASEGLLQLLPNRGARVVRLTERDVEEMFAVMGALEGLAGELAAERIADAEIAEIRALHYQMLLHHTRGELMPYFRLNQQIHAKILEASGNRTLVAQYRMLAGRIRRARYLANISRSRWDEAAEEHARILGAIEARDGAMLARILKAHLRNTCDTVKRAVAAENGGQSDKGIGAPVIPEAAQRQPRIQG